MLRVSTMTEACDRLCDAFAALDDPRVERTKHHALIDVISIAICDEHSLKRRLAALERAQRRRGWRGAARGARGSGEAGAARDMYEGCASQHCGYAASARLKPHAGMPSRR
jgi:hypothetical protein